MPIYFLNESKKGDQIGDINIYSDLDKLTKDIEAIDVRNNEYFCYDSLGNSVHLRADSDYGKITATVSAGGEATDALEKVLDEYLHFLACDGRFGIFEESRKTAVTLADKVKLIPNSLIK